MGVTRSAGVSALPTLRSSVGLPLSLVTTRADLVTSAMAPTRLVGLLAALDLPRMKLIPWR